MSRESIKISRQKNCHGETDISFGIIYVTVSNFPFVSTVLIQEILRCSLRPWFRRTIIELPIRSTQYAVLAVGQSRRNSKIINTVQLRSSYYTLSHSIPLIP